MMRNIFRNAFYVITLLSMISMHAAASKQMDSASRLIALWQRVEYPTLAEKGVLKELKSGTAAVESCLLHHSTSSSGRESERGFKDWVAYGRQDGLIDHVPVLLYQFADDTVALFYLVPTRITIPKFNRLESNMHDTVVAIPIGGGCRHYMTSDKKLVRIPTCVRCPLNDEAVLRAKWDGNDGGVVVPLDGVTVLGAKDSRRSYRYRLLPIPERLKSLFERLQELNGHIDFAENETSDNLERVILSFGTAIPEKAGAETGFFALPASKKTTNARVSLSGPKLYRMTIQYLGSNTFSDLPYNWDAEKGQIVLRPDLHRDRANLADQMLFNDFGSERAVYGVKGLGYEVLHKDRPELLALNLQRTGARLLNLDAYNQILNATWPDIQIRDGHSLLNRLQDSLSRLQEYYSNLLDLRNMIQQIERRIGNEAHRISSKPHAKSGIVVTPAVRGSSALPLSFEIEPQCLFSDPMAALLIKAESRVKNVEALGTYQPLQGYVMKQDEKLGPLLDWVVNEAIPGIRSFALDKKLIVGAAVDSTISVFSALQQSFIKQLETPLAYHNVFQLKGSCTSNNSLNLFAFSFSNDSTLLTADEDDAADIITQRYLTRYKDLTRRQILSYWPTDAELDDYDDSVETYQKMYQEGKLIDRIIEDLNRKLQVSKVDYLQLLQDAESAIGGLNSRVMVLLEQCASDVSVVGESLRQHKRILNFIDSAERGYKAVFSLQQPRHATWPLTNYVGRRVGDIDSAVSSFMVSRGYDNAFLRISDDSLSRAVSGLPTFSRLGGTGFALRLGESGADYCMLVVAQSVVGNTKTWLFEDQLFPNDLQWLPSVSQSILILGQPGRDFKRALFDVHGIYYLGKSSRSH